MFTHTLPHSETGHTVPVQTPTVLWKKAAIATVAAVSLLLGACDKGVSENTSSQTGTDTETTTQTATAEQTANSKVLNVYNWPDYIAADMVKNFEAETGIKVNYQTFETNEALNAKLVAGNSGYDIVVPGAMFAKEQIESGLLRPLDKSKLPNYSNLDPNIMGKLSTVDPNNAHIIPWGWSFNTVGINKGKVEKALGDTPIPANSWELIFNPKYTNKLKSCGIAFLDSPTEILPAAMHYLGKPAFSLNPEDHQAAGEMLAKVRPDVRMFTNTMIDDLVNGNACVVLGWAGDINIARTTAIENQNGEEIEALVPSIGGILFFDNIAVPKDAKNFDNAMAFINFFLRPEVSADLTKELSYPTANKESLEYLDKSVTEVESIFPTAEQLTVMASPSGLTNEARASMNAVYTKFKQGK